MKNTGYILISGRWLRLLALIALVLGLLTPASPAQAAGTPPHTPHMVRDIQTGVDLVSFNNFTSGPSSPYLFFIADDMIHGTELWRCSAGFTDFQMVKDINPTGSSYPYKLTLIDGILYFWANEGTAGRELWKSDGTEAGTMLVKDIFPGVDGQSGYGSIVKVVLSDTSSAIFFTARTSSTGNELWRTDGTPDNTVMVKDINPGANSSMPQLNTAPAISFNHRLFFAADDGTNGQELWSSDGTESGTTLVENLGPGSSAPADFMSIRTGLTTQRLYFTSNSSSYGQEVFYYDTTDGLIHLLKDIVSGAGGSSPQELTYFTGNSFYFTANDGANGRQLYESDGTAFGTQLVEVFPNTNSAMQNLQPALLNGHRWLFFSAYHADYGQELWKTDGTIPAGASKKINLVKDINPGGDSNPQDFKLQNNLLYFRALTDDEGIEPWVTDGTDAGTVILKATEPGYSWGVMDDFISFDSQLIFTAFDGAYTSMWTSGGASGTPHQVIPDITANGGAYFIGMAALGSRLAFKSHIKGSGSELWLSDGSETGTTLLRENRDGALGLDTYAQYGPVAVGNYLFFRGGDPLHGNELWISDGTPGGTGLLADLYPGIYDGYPDRLTAASGFAGGMGYRQETLFFIGNYNMLYRAGSTPESVTLLKDFGYSSSPSNLTPGEGILYFKSKMTSDDSGIELWKSDGTAAGTSLVKDILPGSSGASYGEMVTIGSTLYFTVNDGSRGSELWRSDGTSAGTYLVKDIVAGSGSSTPSLLTPVGNTLFFTADDGINGRELWKSDGTEAGTVMVKDIYPGIAGFESYVMYSANGKLYFNANDGIHGLELWKSDGTPAGTLMVKDIYPGTPNGNPYYMTPFGGWVYFVAQDGVHGYELWATDGTEAGTVMVMDINPGAAHSSPSPFKQVRDQLFFSANDGVHMNELWVLKDNHLKLYLPNVR
jgi:ELWxxDGT repeat protein